MKILEILLIRIEDYW